MEIDIARARADIEYYYNLYIIIDSGERKIQRNLFNIHLQPDGETTPQHCSCTQRVVRIYKYSCY